MSFPLVSAISPLVQAKIVIYVSGNSRKTDKILRVKQALNPDATETKGGWWAKFAPPYHFIAV